METENLIQQDPQFAQAALLAKREAQNRRKQAQRDRDKIKKQEAKETERAERQEREEITSGQRHDEDWGAQDVKNRGLCFLGEVAPGREGKTIHEALFSARRFARAMKEPDVKLGESLTDFEKRICEAWKNFRGFAFENSRRHYSEDGSAPFLCMETGKIEPGWGGGMFHWENWIHLPGADEVLTLEQIRESGKL